jgi:hypothetical protein
LQAQIDSHRGLSTSVGSTEFWAHQDLQPPGPEFGYGEVLDARSPRGLADVVPFSIA